MSLQFITGACGSGKSTYLCRSICQEAKKHIDKNYIILVPDQFTLETQKNMVEFSGGQGILNIDVLSFHRLAYRVLEEMPVHRRTVLEDMGKMMLLRKVFAEEKKNLVYFKRGLNKPGFLDECKSFFCELMQYAITEEDFSDLFGQFEKESLMSYKMQDLQLIYRRFMEKMGDSYMMAEELIPQLTALVPQVGFLKDAVICLDGFTGFTPTQYDLLKVLMKAGSQMYVTVTTDRTGRRSGVFSLSQQVMKKMAKLAEETGTEIQPVVTLGRGEEKAPFRQEEGSELAFLEKNIFAHRYETWKEAPEDIEIRVCKRGQDEAAFAARTIDRLVETEGYQYEDIAVVVGQIKDYEQALAREFHRLNIPFFVDYKKSMGANALAEYVLALLGMYKKNMDYDSTFRFLRCGLSPLTTEETDHLDNYVVAKGKKGYRSYAQEWKSPLRYSDLVAVNEAKDKFVASIKEFFQALRGGKKTVREFSEILYRHLVENHIYQRVNGLAEEFEKMEQALLAREYHRIYRLFMELLDEMVDLLGDETVTFSEYEEILKAGVSEGLVGFTPPEKNQVKIGDRERSRLGDVKVLFFIGVTDDVIPKGAQSPGILSQTEREKLEQMGVELAPQGEEAASMEQYYLYLTLAKPSQKLYLTYCKLGNDGSSRRPAYLINKILGLFETLKVRDEEKEEPETWQILGSDTGKGYLLTKLAAGDYEKDDRFWELAAFYAREESEWWKTMIDRGTPKYEKGRISKAVAEQLYTDKLFGSVTRFEQYAKCPFAHFALYGLGVREREEFAVNAMDYGNVFHKALEHVSHRMEKEKKDWNSLSLDEIREMAKEAIDTVSQEYEEGKYFQNHRTKYCVTRMKRVLQQSMEGIWHQMQQGEFFQYFSEKKFPDKDKMESTHLDLGGGREIVLHGQIDRVDVCYRKDKQLIKIVDYKSSDQQLNLGKVYYGLQIQLLSYMAAAMEIMDQESGQQAEPAAMLYYTVKKPQIPWKPETDKQRRERILKELRCQGYVNEEPYILEALDESLSDGEELTPMASSQVVPVRIKRDRNFYSDSKVLSTEQFEILMEHTKKKLMQYGKEIYEGACGRTPYEMKQENGCMYCHLKGVCGMDGSRGNDLEVRKLDELKEDEVWRLLDGSDKLDE